MSNEKKKFKDKTLYPLLLSHQNKPLRLWNKRVRAGRVSQLLDQDLRNCVLEITGPKSSRTYITCPADPKKVLGIQAPFLHFTVKNLYRSFMVDVLIKDSENVKRRFRALTKQKDTSIKPFLCKMPLILESGWNEVVVPLKDYTRKAYGTKYVETLRVQMHATCRVHKVYFSYKSQAGDEYSMGSPVNVSGVGWERGKKFSKKTEPFFLSNCF